MYNEQRSWIRILIAWVDIPYLVTGSITPESKIWVDYTINLLLIESWVKTKDDTPAPGVSVGVKRISPPSGSARAGRLIEIVLIALS